MEIEIGEEIVADNGMGTVIASSIQGGNDDAINLYLVDIGDHLEVVAQDNATNWVVGDENCMGDNYDMIDTIGAGRLEDFAENVVKDADDSRRMDLYWWIVDRIADAKAFKNMNEWCSCDFHGNVGAHDTTFANAMADCEIHQESEPEKGWEVCHN